MLGGSMRKSTQGLQYHHIPQYSRHHRPRSNRTTYVDTSLRDRVDVLEAKVDKMLSLINKLVDQAGINTLMRHPNPQTKNLR